MRVFIIDEKPWSGYGLLALILGALGLSFWRGFDHLDSWPIALLYFLGIGFISTFAFYRNLSIRFTSLSKKADDLQHDATEYRKFIDNGILQIVQNNMNTLSTSISKDDIDNQKAISHNSKIEQVPDND